MATEAEPDISQLRLPVTKDRLFRAAIAVADAGGLDSLTMRRVADELDVEPMSLYYHVANKAAMLDGVADAVVEEVERAVAELDPPIEQDPWKTALRRRILTAREVMLRHRWAPTVFQGREMMGPATMRYFDAVLGHLREGGFSPDLAHHSIHVLGSKTLGFTQELFEPEGDKEAADEAALEVFQAMADIVPNLTWMAAEAEHNDPDSTIGWCDDQAEFEFSLDLILDGLERLHDRS